MTHHPAIKNVTFTPDAKPGLTREQTQEREIVRSILTGIVSEGYVFSIFDGGEWVVRRSSDIETGLKAMFSTDGDEISVRTPAGERVGTINLIYGNAPWEVVQDHTDNDEIKACLAGATAMSDRMEAAAG